MIIELQKCGVLWNKINNRFRLSLFVSQICVEIPFISISLRLHRSTQ